MWLLMEKEGDKMPPVSKASQRAVAKYAKNNYERIEFRVPKGYKDSIQAAADAVGESLNKYVTKATEQRIARRRPDGEGKKTFTIIGGVNGVGKSSLTGVLKTETAGLGTIIDVDKLTAVQGLSAIEGGKTALRLIRDCFEKELSFTQESTLSSRQIRSAAAEAKEHGFYIRLYYVGLDAPEECLARIANRVARGGHDVGAEDVCRRFSGRWDAVSKVLPYCDEARFFDNDNGFTEVAEYVGGVLALKGDLRPEWVLELSGYLGNLPASGKLLSSL